MVRETRRNGGWLAGRTWRLMAMPLLAIFAAQVFAGEATLVIDNARVVVGNGPVIDRATIVIQQDRIDRVIVGSQPVDAARHIDAQGMTVMPGLIDTHVHLIQPDGATTEADYRQYLTSDVPGNLAAYLEHGVTTIRSIGDAWDLIFELRSKVNSREIAGPRLYIVGSCISVPGGHPSATLFKDSPWAKTQIPIDVTDVKSAKEAVERLARSGVDGIKLVYDSGPFSPGGDEISTLSPELLSVIIQKAHELKLRATVHTWREKEAITAAEAKADGLEHGVAEDLLTGPRLGDLLCENKAYYVPTLSVFEEYRNLLIPGALDNAKRNLQRLSDQGVNIALGTDTFGGGKHGVRTIREIELMAVAGLSPAQIIRAATCNAAAHLGVADQLGTVEKGKYADLIIVKDDPLKEVAAFKTVRVVIRGGQVVHEAAGN